MGIEEYSLYVIGLDEKSIDSELAVLNRIRFDSDNFKEEIRIKIELLLNRKKLLNKK